MSKKSYLNELKKIITLYKIEENDSYYDIYEYICKTQRDLKILLIIDETIIERIESKKKYLEKTLKKNFNGEIIDYNEFPVIGDIIKNIVVDDLIEYKALQIIEGNQPLESSQGLSSKNIAELEIRIYKAILEEIKEIEKKYNKKEENKPREKQILDLKEKIEQKCISILIPVEINNKRLVKEGKIDLKLFKELYNLLDDDTIKILHELTKIETEKTGIYYNIKNIFEILENLNDIFYSLILEIINEKVEKIDNILTITILDPKYKKEKSMLMKNNNLNKNQVDLGEYLLDYMEKFDIEIYEMLNIRCRLMEIYNMIKETTPNIKIEKIISETEKANLKKELQNQIKNISIESTSSTDIIMLLKDTLNKFQRKKEKELIQNRSQLIKQKELESTLISLLPKECDIKSLYTPICKNITTPLEAIYIYNTLISINESGRNIDRYKELIEFVSDEQIKIIKPEIENIIRQIINEQFEKYYEEIKNKLILKETTEEPQKRLTYEGD